MSLTATPVPRFHKLFLEDLGQDFLYFVVDGRGRIVKAGPFQDWFWSGKTLTVSTFAPGDYLYFEDDGARLNYRVERVEPLEAWP
jgi:CRP-like cAMP-binding protein